MDQSATMSAADVLSRYGGSVPDATAPDGTTQAPVQQSMTGADVLARYGGKAPASADAPSYVSELESEANALWAGGVHGANSVMAKPAQMLTNLLTKHGGMAKIRNALQGIPYVGVSADTANNLFPDGPALQAQQAAQEQAYQKQYAGNPNAAIGNFAGENMLTLPAMGAGGALLRAGGSALAGGMADAAPTLSKVAQYGTDFLSGAAGVGKAGKLALAEKAASRAAAGATAGAAYNGATGNPLTSGAEAGAALGPAGGVVGDVAKAAASKISPLLDPATRALAAKAEQFGIKLRGPQITDSSFVKYADSSLRNLPAMGYEKADAQVQGQFNNAVAKQMGTTAQKITPQVMQDTKERLGQAYDSIVPSLSIKPDDEVLTKLGGIEHEASQALPDSELKPIQTQINNILNGFKDGQEMPGDYAHNLIKKGSPLDRSMNSSDPNVAYYAGQIRQTLNDAMTRNAPPEVAQKLTETNAQYKAMKTIEPLVEKSTTGDMSPALLMSQVRKSYGGMAYNGGGDMGDLARIGQRFLKEPPNSGTAPRNMIYHALGAMGGLGAVAISPEVGLSHLAAAGSLGGMVAAGKGLKAALDSRAYYNSLMGRPGAPVMNWLLQR